MTKRSVLLASVCMVLLFGGCAGKQVVQEKPYTHGQVVTSSGSPISVQDLARNLSGVDYILVAETHNDGHHHQMQADILAALAASGLRPTLGLEMITKDKQATLDLFNKNKITVAQLPGKIDWSGNWSFPYNLYDPVFQVAKKNNIPVVGLNTPRSTARAVASDKSVPAAEMKWLPRRLLTGKTFDKAELDKRGPRADSSMTTSDYAKKTLTEYGRLRVLYESSMADTAVDVRSRNGGPVVIMVGVENLRNGKFGLAKRLHEFDPSGKIAVILPTQTGDKDRFCKVEEPSDQMKAAINAGVQVYFFCSLPGRAASYK